MDKMCNGNAGIFIPVVQKNTLETSLGRVYEKTPVWRIIWQTKGRKQARYVCTVAQLVFHVEKEARSLFWFLKLVILTSFWTRFHCLSREAKSSDCCFDRYKSRARSFRSSCVNHVAYCHLLLNMLTQYLPKILTRQNPPLKVFLRLMRKEDPFLLEVWVQEYHLNGERVS